MCVLFLIVCLCFSEFVVAVDLRLILPLCYCCDVLLDCFCCCFDCALVLLLCSCLLCVCFAFAVAFVFIVILYVMLFCFCFACLKISLCSKDVVRKGFKIIAV